MPGTVCIDDTVRIQWWSNPKDTILSSTALILRRGGDQLTTLGVDQTNAREWDWTVSRHLSTGDGYTIQIVAMHINETVTVTTTAFSIDIDGTHATIWLLVGMSLVTLLLCGWWCQKHRRRRTTREDKACAGTGLLEPVT